MVRARRGSSADLWVATAVYDRRFAMSAASTLLTFLHTGNPTGLKFLVEHGDARCLFDFGREHAPGRTLFSLGLEPRHGRELADLLAAGAAPALEGVYAGDAWDGRTHLFITHMHLDHTGLIPLLGPGVPLYYPAAMQSVRSGSAFSPLTTTCPAPPASSSRPPRPASPSQATTAGTASAGS